MNKIGELVVISGVDKGRTFPLEEGQPLRIGRGDAADTKLRDQAVSRLHCQVECQGERLVLSSLSTTSGTKVNGRQITSHELRGGDLIRIGDSELRFVPATPAETRAPAPAAGVTQEPLSELVGKTFTHFTIGQRIANAQSGWYSQPKT